MAQTLYIKVPKYFMITLGEENIDFNDNFTYDTIELPKLNIEDINNPIMVSYNLISVICHPHDQFHGHFYSIVNKDNMWVKFNDNFVSILNDTDYRQNIKNEGKFFIYKINEDVTDSDNLLEKVNLYKFDLDSL